MLFDLFHGCSSVVCSQFVLDLFPAFGMNPCYETKLWARYSTTPDLILPESPELSYRFSWDGTIESIISVDAHDSRGFQLPFIGDTDRPFEGLNPEGLVSL
jgi:hypothetical protein